MAEMTTRCARCGGIVRLDSAVCPACGAPRGAEAEGAIRKPALPAGADLEIQVYSRLMWGEAPQQVRAEFLRLGAKPSEFDPLLRTLEQRRRDHYRKLGVRNLAAGIGLLVLGAVAIWLAYLWVHGEVKKRRVTAWLLVAPVALPVMGLLLILRGARRIAKPGEGEREEAELEEDD